MPAATPLTVPVDEPIVAMAGEPELHMPPAVGLVSVVVEPWHTAGGPAIGNGSGLTVIVAEVAQPVPTEYEMVTVPAATPVSTPDAEPMVAMPVAPDVHVPPGVALLSEIVLPIHAPGPPVIGAGEELTVTTFVA